MSKRTIVIGGTGFLGKALVGALQASQPVAVGARRSDPAVDVEFRSINLLHDNDLINKLKGFSCLINCTGQLTNPLSACAALNSSGVVKLTQAARAAGVRQFVQISSSAVYGVGGEFSEEVAPNASTPYGALKLASDNIVINEFSDALVIRLSNLYCRNARSGLFAYLVRQYKSGDHRLYLNNNGGMTRQYLHVFDAANIIATLVNSNISGIFNVAGSDYLSAREVINLFERKLEVRFDCQFEDTDFGELFMNCEKIKKTLDLVFKHSIEGEVDEVQSHG